MKSEKSQLKNENWRRVKLGEVVILNSHVKLEKNEKYPFILMEEVGAEKKYIYPSRIKKYKGGGAKFSNGDILFARITPSLEHGKMGVVKFEGREKIGFGSTEFFVFRGKKNITCTNYLYYLLKTYKLRQVAINSMVGVSGRQRARIEAIANYKINLPSLDEQKRIAELLSAFDEKIEVNNKINQTLEEMAQAIFEEWFVDSEKLKVKSEKSKLIKINELVHIISGYPFSSKLYNKQKKGLGVVTIKNVQNGNFITNCDSYIDKESIPKNINKECYLHNGDILLSLTGNVGRICFVYGGKYLLNQRVAKLKLKNAKNRAFTYFLFRQPTIQNLLVSMAKGSAQPNLSPVETGEIELTIPSREILDKFSEIVNPIYEQLINNKAENQALAALRDLLLPKLMSGEIRV